MSTTSSSVDYGRKLVSGGLNGARSGSGEFLKGKPIASVVTTSARSAICPAVLGTCLGILSGVFAGEKKSAGRAVLFGLGGCALGFSAGVAWKNRQLAASVAQGAAKNIGQVRQEHWMEKNSIAYA
jgi:hypothetical protein